MLHVAHPTTAPRSSAPRALLLAAVSFALLYAVGFDPTVHELMHDGRHLLGIPCH